MFSNTFNQQWCSETTVCECVGLKGQGTVNVMTESVLEQSINFRMIFRLWMKSLFVCETLD
jgi:hypothetical protein